MKLSRDYLRRVLRYDMDTGEFVWLLALSRNVEAGSKAGCLRQDGYRVICVGRRRYPEHRLAWLYVHGEWPPDDIDHINGDRADNRLANLRLATRTMNNGNSKRRTDNTSGHKGVYWNAQRGKWQAKIRRKGVEKHLGLFDDKAAAAAAYRRAAESLFGEFACYSR